LTLFFMVILGFMSVALFNMMPQEMRQAQHNQTDTQAHYVATSGIKHALAFLHFAGDTTSVASSWTPYPNNPYCVPAGYDYSNVTLTGNTSPVTNTSLGLTPWAYNSATMANQPDLSWYPDGIWALALNGKKFSIGGWGLETYIVGDVYTWGGCNTVPGFHQLIGTPYSQPNVSAYTIVTLVFRDLNGNGVCDAGETYYLRAKANVALGSFAKYAFFAGNWDNSQAFTLPSDTSQSVVSGPFHTNTYPQFFAPGSNNYWSQPVDGVTTFPSFNGQISYSTKGSFLGNPPLNYDGIGWIEGNVGTTNQAFRPYDANNNPVSNYSRLVAGGAASISQVKALALPSTVTGLAAAAWGSTAEQALVTQQNGLAADSVYVNSQVTNAANAAGGVYIKGNVSQMELQVLGANGQPTATTPATRWYPTAPPTATRRFG